MQQPIPMNGRFYYGSGRAAAIAGIPAHTLANWMKAGVTSYGYSLDCAVEHGHQLIDEGVVVVLGAVEKEFPRAKGPIPPDRQEQMRAYAARVRAKLTPRT